MPAPVPTTEFNPISPVALGRLHTLSEPRLLRQVVLPATKRTPRGRGDQWDTDLLRPSACAPSSIPHPPAFPMCAPHTLQAALCHLLPSSVLCSHVFPESLLCCFSFQIFIYVCFLNQMVSSLKAKACRNYLFYCSIICYTVDRFLRKDCLHLTMTQLIIFELCSCLKAICIQ